MPAPSERPQETWTPPSTGFKLIGPEFLLEEEAIPGYKAESYYPVSLGQVFQERYQVVGKLGFGGSSTVWLCRDHREHRYIALKVYANNNARGQRELPVLQHINRTLVSASEHAGSSFLRRMLDWFEVDGPHGRHICLVHEALGGSLYDMKNRAPYQVLNTEILRPAIRALLLALEYLHDVTHVIHTDIQLNNLLMGFKDESILERVEKSELLKPAPRKILGDRTIYSSRSLPITRGIPRLCDFGEARFGDGNEDFHADIMPDIYRTPEVILGMKWSYSVDIWGAAMVMWDLLHSRPIFRARRVNGEYDDGHHLAEMIAIIGPPPLDFLKRSEENTLYWWDETGNWRDRVPIPEISLESLEDRFEGEDRENFLDLMRSVLCWKPEERPTALEMMYHPWLMSDLLEERDKERQLEAS